MIKLMDGKHKITRITSLDSKGDKSCALICVVVEDIIAIMINALKYKQPTTASYAQNG